MKLFKHINIAVNATKFFFSVSYYYLKFKLNLTTYNNAVISACDSFVRKNYLFSKVIQWGVQEIHSSTNIKDNDELKSYFSAFSNSVPYTQHELQSALIHLENLAEYAKSCNDELVIENDDVPTNSGTVALVFKARLNSAPVIIKVLRHNIKNRIQNDINATLYFFTNIFIRTIIRYYIKLNFNTFIQDNSELLLKQCDFISEVNNALLFKDNSKNKKNIIIPYVYKHFTEANHDVIVMEYLNGPIAKNISVEEMEKYSEILQTFFFESLFQYNMLHGDFHLGNIIAVNDTTIGIIDFGIVFHLTRKLSNLLFDMLFLAISFNVDNPSNNYSKFCKLIKNSIRYTCSEKSQHEFLYNILKNDKELLYIVDKNFSSNMLIIIINKIMCIQDVKLKPQICQLFLSAMSSLQTTEYANNNMSLESLMNSFINRSIKI